MNTNAFKTVSSVCRWTARTLGLLLLFVVLRIAVGQGIPNPFTQPLRVQLGFLALTLLLVGFVAGWQWELARGIRKILDKDVPLRLQKP